MADETSGIDLMRRRMERASRKAPPPPRRAPAPASETAGEGGGASAPTVVADPPAAARSHRPAASTSTPRPAEMRRERLAPDLPPVNLAIRVRKPLDDRLADLIHGLRREGVRTSKVELIEMLLWELPADPGDTLRARLRRFRDHAPRGAGAPFGDRG